MWTFGGEDMVVGIIGGGASGMAAALALLVDPTEIELIRTLSYMPSEIISAGKAYDPSKMPKYAINLATQFHRFYNACRVRDEEENLMRARLKLIESTRIVIKNVLDILGVSAPEKM